jgi:hypothetical protein
MYIVNAGVPEAVAMTVSGHADPNVFKRYHVRRDVVQADALARQQAYLETQRGTAATPARHDSRARRQQRGV